MAKSEGGKSVGSGCAGAASCPGSRRFCAELAALCASRRHGGFRMQEGCWCGGTPGARGWSRRSPGRIHAGWVMWRGRTPGSSGGGGVGEGRRSGRDPAGPDPAGDAGGGLLPLSAWAAPRGAAAARRGEEPCTLHRYSSLSRAAGGAGSGVRSRSGGCVSPPGATSPSPLAAVSVPGLPACCRRPPRGALLTSARVCPAAPSLGPSQPSLASFLTTFVLLQSFSRRGSAVGIGHPGPLLGSGHPPAGPRGSRGSGGAAGGCTCPGCSDGSSALEGLWLKKRCAKKWRKTPNLLYQSVPGSKGPCGRPDL